MLKYLESWFFSHTSDYVTTLLLKPPVASQLFRVKSKDFTWGNVPANLTFLLFLNSHSKYTSHLRFIAPAVPPTCNLLLYTYFIPLLKCHHPWQALLNSFPPSLISLLWSLHSPPATHIYFYLFHSTRFLGTYEKEFCSLLCLFPEPWVTYCRYSKKTKKTQLVEGKMRGRNYNIPHFIDED